MSVMLTAVHSMLIFKKHHNKVEFLFLLPVKTGKPIFNMKRKERLENLQKAPQFSQLRDTLIKDRIPYIKMSILQSQFLEFIMLYWKYTMAFQVIEYSSKYFKSLKRRCLEKNLALALTHKDFVEWYYNSNNRCKLYLLIEGNEVLASLGQELIDFVYKGQKMPISFLSNFVSFDAGHGGFLFLHWIKNFKYCGIFGGSEYTQTLCRNQGWKFFQGFNVFSLNREIRINSNDGILKRTGKKISNALSKKRFQRFLYRLPSLESNSVKIKVIEIRDYKNNIQAFLEKPNIYYSYVNQDLKYLNWRFNTHLGFVRYRAFEVYNQDKLSAYLIVNEGRNKIYISDLFLENPADFEVIFYNFLKKYSYKELMDKEIIISTSNLHIKTSINSIGFESRPRPFAIGSINANIDILDDTTQWLINIGISDNDLRYPFLNDSIL